MASLDDGKYNTMSSLSIVASRATVAAQDIVATSTLSAPALTVQTITQTLASSTSLFAVQVNSGSAILPTLAFNSEVSLGFYRSAASQIAQSYGTFNVTGIAATRYQLTGSSATTAASGATAKLADGLLFFSVQSLTSNGGEFGFRSGNTVYRFASIAVG